MPVKGWLAIRNLPVPKKKKLESIKDYSSILSDFFKDNTICEVCSGRGYTSDYIPGTKDSSEVHSVKIDFKEFELLKEAGCNLSDKAKQIIEMKICNRKSCSFCGGTGFVIRGKVNAVKKVKRVVNS